MQTRMKSLKDHLRAALTIYKDHFSAARTQTRPVAQTRFPPSSPGATLCEKTLIRSHQPAMAKRWKQPFQCKMQAYNQTYWHSAWNLSKITSAQCWQWGPLEHSTNANRTRRTHEVPPIVAGSHFAWENTGFRAPRHNPSKHWKQPFQFKMQAWITKHNGTVHAIFQRSPPRSADNSTCARHERKPHPSHKRGSPHGRPEPLYARKHDKIPCDFYN